MVACRFISAPERSPELAPAVCETGAFHTVKATKFDQFARSVSLRESNGVLVPRFKNCKDCHWHPALHQVFRGFFRVRGFGRTAGGYADAFRRCSEQRGGKSPALCQGAQQVAPPPALVRKELEKSREHPSRVHACGRTREPTHARPFVGVFESLFLRDLANFWR